MASIRALVLRLVVLAVALGIGFGPAHAHAGGPGGPCLHRTLAPSPATAHPATHPMAAAHHHGATSRPAAIAHPMAASPDDPSATRPAPCADACVCAVCVTLPALSAATDDAPVARLRVGPALSGALPGIEPDRPDPPPRSPV